MNKIIQKLEVVNQVTTIELGNFTDDNRIIHSIEEYFYSDGRPFYRAYSLKDGQPDCVMEVRTSEVIVYFA